ncbi:MAG: acyl-ACP--UDP-N-acetylglucosamine O-acyltransferase [Planctomycetota bacterium]
MSIDPYAIVHPTAQVGPGVEIGPFSIVEPGAIIGPGCKISSRVTIKSGVTLGEQNTVEEGAVLGGLPQHLSPPDSPGPVIIGDRNIIRENVTVHRAMKAEGETRIGNGCLLMVASHVAHDCTVADGAVLTNNVMLGGHVSVGSRAFLGGGSAVHQFCRIGRLAMVGGMARVAQDVPPFVMVDGGTGLIVGLNRVGLRRAELSRTELADLKSAYQIIYRSGLSLEDRLAELDATYSDGAAAEFAPFFRQGGRGFVRERRTPPAAPATTIRVVHADDAVDQTRRQRKAG